MVTAIHPFPARMAPELACESLAGLPSSSRVLDPMCGSGTVLRASVEAGFACSGVDIDPLAVLMSRVWTTQINTDTIRSDARKLVAVAKALPVGELDPAADAETQLFLDYWFGPVQRGSLARLATALRRHVHQTSDALALALSRIIVTKEMRASLARDTSHSRPHKVAESNDFDVYGGFVRSADQLARRLHPKSIRESADVRLGDARMLDHAEDGSFDLAITSPPYLNAIDYLRGHRLSLVWLGHALGSLRLTRASSIGAERTKVASSCVVDVSPYVLNVDSSSITRRHIGWITRYAADVQLTLAELSRVVKPQGKVVLVLGNSFLRGATVDNVRLVEDLAVDVGLALNCREVREIPARRRYLPPPGDQNGALDSRMRTEAVLTFISE